MHARKSLPLNAWGIIRKELYCRCAQVYDEDLLNKRISPLIRKSMIYPVSGFILRAELKVQNA